MPDILQYISCTLNQERNAAMKGWHTGRKEISGSGGFNGEGNINIRSGRRGGQSQVCDSGVMIQRQQEAIRKMPALALDPVYLECRRTGRHKQRGCRENSIFREEPSPRKPSTFPSIALQGGQKQFQSSLVPRGALPLFICLCILMFTWCFVHSTCLSLLLFIFLIVFGPYFLI